MTCIELALENALIAIKSGTGYEEWKQSDPNLKKYTQQQMKYGLLLYT